MKFRIVIHGTRIIALAVVLIGVLGGFMRNDFFLTSIGITAIACVVVIAIRYYVNITDEMLEVSSLFTTYAMRWNEIKEVRRKFTKLEIYEFIAANSVVKINFNLFSKACYDEVFKRLPSR